VNALYDILIKRLRLKKTENNNFTKKGDGLKHLFRKAWEAGIADNGTYRIRETQLQFLSELILGE
jgi:hypothetical protein